MGLTRSELLVLGLSIFGGALGNIWVTTWYKALEPGQTNLIPTAILSTVFLAAIGVGIMIAIRKAPK